MREPRIVETHVSWVVLTGEWAYKIKKPVRLPFLDFSTLARRKHYCEEELRLNRRLAPQLYEAVVAIGGDPSHPRVGAEPILEYAVRMRQFAPEAELDRQLAAGTLDAASMRALGDRIGRFHMSAAVAERASPYGKIDEIAAPAVDNLEALRRALHDAPERAWLEETAAWTHGLLLGLRPQFDARKAAGWIREGHGDLHLRNLVALPDGITAFDCLEFDPHLRWIDVICDVAFLVMDLELNAREDLAYAFFDAYLETTGDYGGVELLDFYRVYRALVRAKVAALRAAQLQGNARGEAQQDCRAHLALARRYQQPRTPRLLLMHGYSGSGKSWLAERLSGLLPAIRLRSDVERKRLAGLAARASSGSAVGQDLYSSGMSARTYGQMERIVRELLRSGQNVIVDAAFLQYGQRAPFAALAQALGLPCTIIDCTAPGAVLEARIGARAGDPSEADTAVLAYQRRVAEALRPEERVIAVRTDAEVALPALVQRIRQPG